MIHTGHLFGGRTVSLYSSYDVLGDIAVYRRILCREMLAHSGRMHECDWGSADRRALDSSSRYLITDTCRRFLQQLASETLGFLHV